jgi:hypothetical protein
MQGGVPKIDAAPGRSNPVDMDLTSRLWSGSNLFASAAAHARTGNREDPVQPRMNTDGLGYQAQRESAEYQKSDRNPRSDIRVWQGESVVYDSFA